jgi:Uma2 family endonuclease
MVMALATHWTAEMVRALPDDGNRYEVVDGELLVTPSPARRHQGVLWRLQVALATYLKSVDMVDAGVTSPADISWAGDILVQPDLFVVAPAEARAAWPGIQTLLLVVEVLSPGTARADRNRKRLAYQRHNVGCYWIVDHEHATVEIWRPGDTAPTLERERVLWQITPHAPLLEISLTELFAEMPG